MTNKKVITDFTKNEFVNFIRDIFTANPAVYKNEAEYNAAILLFEEITEHPDGSDLIFYPKGGHDTSPVEIMIEVMAWRQANGKSVIK